MEYFDIFIRYKTYYKIIPIIEKFDVKNDIYSQLVEH